MVNHKKFLGYDRNEDGELIINEMEAAESLFNNTNDPRLIEAAIYKETAAKKRFDYLFSIAKEEYGEIIEI